MKKLLLQILILLMPIVLNGQSYKPLLVDGNKWNILYVPYATGWKCAKSYSTQDSTGTEVLRLSSDTIINGLKYKSILLSIDSLSTISDTLGIIREDTINQRVYYWSRKEYMDDSLLYDFNVNIKDNILYYTVDTIDSIYIGTCLHKRIRLSDKLDWIEGIGSTNGILSSSYPMPLCGTVYFRTLLCFYNNDSLLYQTDNAAYKDCFYRTKYVYVGVKTEVYKIGYTLYPNPSKDNIIISSDNNGHFILEIADIQGHVLISKELLNRSNQINLQGINSGIYFVRITNNEGIFTYKIIKE